jgi:hypothetical protein
MASVTELRTMAKALGIRGYSVAKKADLISLIEKNQGKTPVAKTEEVKKEAPVQVEVAKAEEPPKPTEIVKHTRKQSDWNSHLAEYRKVNNCSLRDAMNKARESYVEKKQAKPATHDKP